MACCIRNVYEILFLGSEIMSRTKLIWKFLNIYGACRQKRLDVKVNYTYVILTWKFEGWAWKIQKKVYLCVYSCQV
jgi:hypothetical protein